MSEGPVPAAVAALRAGYDTLAALPLDALTQTELLDVLDDLEALACRLPTQWHRALAQLQAETTSQELGAKSWRDVLTIRWRLSPTEAVRRLAEAHTIGPRHALTGEPIDPLLAYTAAARAHGLINPEHVKVIRDAIAHVPPAVDVTTREQIEADLVRLAVGIGPKELKDAADKVLFLLGQDGPEPDDAERQRRRGLHVGKQGPDGMIPIRGFLTPEAWATYEAIFAKWAAPGMCNADDELPRVSGTPSQEQVDGDHRTVGQRNHDALIAVGRSVLCSGELGQHNGLPTTIIIRTTLQDLESRAGVGVTGGGTVMPITDVVRLGGHANHNLAVFDNVTGAALDLFRTRRVASPAQRIMLIARDGGCTKPCCTVGAYGSQVHHALRDWADDGNTNVNELALACGPDNRLVDTNGGWSTTINAHGDVEWTPPPRLDTGQARVNHYHRPERLLRPLDDEAEADQPPTPDQDRCRPEPLDPLPVDEPGHPDEPGGPEPPESPWDKRVTPGPPPHTALPNAQSSEDAA